MSTPLTRVVRVQPDGGPHVVVRRPRRRSPPRLRVASVPTVIMRSTPAARAAAIAAAAPPGIRSSSRWQWLSVQRHDADQSGTVEPREQRRALRRPRGRPGSRPTLPRAGSRWSSTDRREPDALPDRPGRVSGWPGEASTATMRSASSASPSTASTAGPGSAFHGSLASRWALVARISCHVASSASARLHARPTLRPRRSNAGRGGVARAGCRAAAPDRCRRTSCRRRWRRGRAGCRGCWRGRRCSARPGPRR